MPDDQHWFDRFGGAGGRLVLSVIVAIPVVILMPHHWSWTLRSLAGWNVGAFVNMAIAWTVILNADADRTQRRCRTEDSSRGIVDVLLTVATIISIGAVGLALHDSESGGSTPSPAFGVGIPILSVILGWLTVHTLFGLHYARLFYHNNDDDLNGPPAGGIDFHEKVDGPPDFRDFLYVSFSIACTYGVTDVEINCKAVRRTVWKHGILSFVFATIVIALAVNVITNLLSGK